MPAAMSAAAARREGRMRGRRGRAWLAGGTALLALALPTGPAAAQCDRFDPAGPARSALIRLDAGDLVAHGGDELRSFVETGSLGPAAAVLVSAIPPGIVLGVRAVPEVSRFSRHYGEALQGVTISVALKPGTRPESVVVRLRQVCARYFRNTFLYY
jgi:hypothetical protein